MVFLRRAFRSDEIDITLAVPQRQLAGNFITCPPCVGGVAHHSLEVTLEIKRLLQPHLLIVQGPSGTIFKQRFHFRDEHL